MALEREFTFRNTSLPQRCYSVFVDMRNQNEFLDIEMNFGTQRISAHRVILAAAIPLFRETFSSEDEISVSNIDPTVFECLVNYAYSCELKITMDNVRGLLSGSCVLQMNDVQDACCDFLLQRLHLQNVMSFGNLADDLNLPKLKEYVDLHVRENFEEVSKTKEFLDSPFEYVQELIAKDDLNVDSEEKVLDSVLRWVKASVIERENYLPQLLGKVRMVLLKPLYLTEVVEKEQLIRMSLICRDLVDEARNYNLFPERKCCSFVTQPRKFMNISEGTQQTDTKLYCLNAELKYTVRQLDLINETWKTQSTDDYLINHGSIAEFNRKLYFFHDDFSLEYEPELDDYQLRTPFTVPKCFSAAVSLGNKILVCGGCIGSWVASNAVECYEPQKKESKKLNSLQKARWSLNSVSVGDYVYALGGRDRFNVYDTVERYSFVLDKWQYMSPMLTPRYRAGATVFNGNIYVCGGMKDVLKSQPIETAEMYDPHTNKWKFISSMNTARWDLTLHVFSGELYAIDLKNNFGKLPQSCEVYDLLTDKWKCDRTFNGSGGVSGVIVL